MILIDTSIYIAAIEDLQLEKLLEQISQKFFIQSCDVVEEEIHDSSEFLRKTNRKQQSEKLKLIYNRIHKGSIGKTERIFNLAKGYHKESEFQRRMTRI